MTFPRISSLVLATGGSFWALALLRFTFHILPYSANSGSGLLVLLIWVPGFFAWYGYIRHAFGHYLFHQARFTWLVSLAANTWSLFLIGGRVGIALAWIIFALVLSLACAIKEWKLREPERKIPAHVTGEEYRKLLGEHRKKER